MKLSIGKEKRFYLLFLSIMAAALLMVPGRPGAVIVDRIVAIVNGDVITLSELEQRAAPVLNQYITPEMSPKERAEARREILARILPQMIDDKLVDEEIKRLGITVKDSEIDGVLQRMFRENGITMEEFRDKLAQQGVTLEEYRQQIRKQIERARLVNAQVQQKIVITDEQVKAYLRKRQGGSSQYGGPYYRIEHILIAPKGDDPYSRQEARKRAQEALDELKSGSDFLEVARRFSDAGPGGVSLGVFSMDEMAPVLRKAIEGLKPGEYSEIIETPMGFQILRLAAVSNTKEEEFDPMVMEETREKLYNMEMESRFQEWLNELRSKSAIRILL